MWRNAIKMSWEEKTKGHVLGDVDETRYLLDTIMKRMIESIGYATRRNIFTTNIFKDKISENRVQSRSKHCYSQTSIKQSTPTNLMNKLNERQLMEEYARPNKPYSLGIYADTF